MEQGREPVVHTLGDALVFQSAPGGQVSGLAFVEPGQAVQIVTERLALFGEAAQHTQGIQQGGDARDRTHRSEVAAAVTAVMA